MTPAAHLLLARFTLAVARRPDILRAEPWYRREGDRIRAWARELGIPERVATDCAAVLSPATEWEALVARLPGFFRAAVRRERRPIMPGYGANVRKAWAMLRGETASVPAQPSGPKVSRFARNLAGDPDAVTVDRWAARAAGLPDHGGARWYRELEASYRAAALAARIAPAQFQAVLWVAVRERIIPCGGRESANPPAPVAEPR